MRSRATTVLLAATVVACGGDGLPPLTDATSLACPTPGDLPFRLASTGYQSSADKTIAGMDPVYKDEASDTIGNPGGPYASIYLDQSAAPSSDPIAYHGVKARTGEMQGIEETPLVGENVSLWYVDEQATWQMLGHGQTADDGSYDVPAMGYEAPNGSAVYAMLEADSSCAASYNLLLAAGSKVVVFDIDGTLTLSDSEFLMQLANESYVPMQMGAASALANAWAMKGYPVVYLTARANEFRAETAAWLATQNFPVGATITGANSSAAQAYKTVWLERMATTFGWNIVAAYGNADTDIAAYDAAGIPKTQTFIVGPLAGSDGTVAIDNMDFTSHITTYVDAQPDDTD